MKNPLPIAVENLSFRYDQQAMILKDINFTVQRGEFLALVGENGAGKTTLAKHFNGLLKPTGGRLMICGLDTAHYKVSQLASKVGYVFQNPDHQIFHDSVEEEIAFGLKNHALAKEDILLRVEEALTAVSLQDCRHAYPQELSKGQRQRVALASVLAMQPEVIVLDEPTTGQDYRESTQIMAILQRLNEQGHTIIMITHDMSLVAQYAHRVLVLYQGRILADDSVKRIFSRPKVLASTKVDLPPVTRLAQGLGHISADSNWLTVTEALLAIQEKLGRKTND